MRSIRLFYCACLGFLLAVAPAPAFENVSMDTSITVEGGQIVAHWSARDFDHYNIRWSANGGPEAQLEREGDKSFRFLAPYSPGVIYKVKVQGCDGGVGRSTCTSWDEATCGDPRHPCTGPIPLPIVSGGGLCLDVDALHQHDNGARVGVWQCNGSDQQRWTLPGGGRIVSLAGKCLDVNLPELQKDGGTVQVWDCNGSAQQHWMPQGGAFVTPSRKCLDVDAAWLRRNGGRVQIWACNKSIQQTWHQPGIM